MRSFLRLLKLHKLAVVKLDLLSWGGLTQCHGVLDHGLNLRRNIPLREVGNGTQVRRIHILTLSMTHCRPHPNRLSARNACLFTPC